MGYGSRHMRWKFQQKYARTMNPCG